MREILFRGQRFDGTWVQGFFYGTNPVNPNESYIGFVSNQAHSVKTDTIGQYTGFKDKNGNKIFECQTVEEIIEDKVEESGFYTIQSKVEFAFGCWVVCQIGFDYSNSEFEDFNLLNDCAHCVSVFNEC